MSEPRALSIPFVSFVTTRKIKVDALSQGLASENAFKSRHCVDGARQRSMLNARGLTKQRVETSSSVVDDLAVKMALADAAIRYHNIAKADVPDAYLRGDRGRSRIGRPPL